MQNSDWVIVGRFGRTHGIKGFITVISFTDPIDNILNYDNWHVRTKNQWQPLKLLKIEINNKFILTQVEGYPEREQVACLTNLDIAIKRSQLPRLPPGEYYWDQLVGMNVLTKHGTELGIVNDIFATGSNDVLVVKGDKRYLIPYLVPEVIMNVDIAQNEIQVDWDADF